MFPNSVFEDPNLIEDHPINLRDPELLKNPRLLPQMRLLHHDQSLLECTFEILLWSNRESQISKDDRAKIEEFFQLVIPNFYKLDYKKIEKKSHRLRVLKDSEVKLIESKEAYLEAKKEEYAFIQEKSNEERLSNDD